MHVFLFILRLIASAVAGAAILLAAYLYTPPGWAVPPPLPFGGSASSSATGAKPASAPKTASNPKVADPATVPPPMSVLVLKDLHPAMLVFAQLEDEGKLFIVHEQAIAEIKNPEEMEKGQGQTIAPGIPAENQSLDDWAINAVNRLLPIIERRYAEKSPNLKMHFALSVTNAAGVATGIDFLDSYTMVNGKKKILGGGLRIRRDDGSTMTTYDWCREAAILLSQTVNGSPPPRQKELPDRLPPETLAEKLTTRIDNWRKLTDTTERAREAQLIYADFQALVVGYRLTDTQAQAATAQLLIDTAKRTAEVARWQVYNAAVEFDFSKFTVEDVRDGIMLTCLATLKYCEAIAASDDIRTPAVEVVIPLEKGVALMDIVARHASKLDDDPDIGEYLRANLVNAFKIVKSDRGTAEVIHAFLAPIQDAGGIADWEGERVALNLIYTKLGRLIWPPPKRLEEEPEPKK